MKNKILIGFGAFVLLLVVTNPTDSEFEKYIHSKTGTRRWNFLIYSIYEDNRPSYTAIEYSYGHQDRVWHSGTNQKYIGIAKNFFRYD